MKRWEKFALISVLFTMFGLLISCGSAKQGVIKFDSNGKYKSPQTITIVDSVAKKMVSHIGPFTNEEFIVYYENHKDCKWLIDKKKDGNHYYIKC